MKVTKTIADQAWEVESFVVEFRSLDGDDVSSRRFAGRRVIHKGALIPSLGQCFQQVN